MSVRNVLVACGVLVVAGGLWWFAAGSGGAAKDIAPLVRGGDDTEVAPSPGELAAADVGDRRTAAAEDAAPVGDATKAGEADEAEAAPIEADDAQGVIRGRVLDLRGRPVEGVTVRGVAASPRAVSAVDGSFEVAYSGVGSLFGFAHQAIATDDKNWVTVYESPFSQKDPEREHLVVVAPAIRLQGVVRNPDGEPIPDANVSLDDMYQVGREFPLPLDANRVVHFSVQTGEDGTFDLDPAPSLPDEPDVGIIVHESNHETGEAELPTASKAGIVIELTPIEPGERVFEGLVLLPDGSPAKGARVRWGERSAQAEDDGRFRLELEDEPDHDLPLAAGLEGYRPALREDFSQLVRANAPGVPPPLTLQLGEALSISGVVLDADGEPQRGWEVRLADPTALSRWQVPVIQAEELSSGKRSVTTKRDGTFRLDGLFDRKYRLRAYTSKTLLQLESEPLAAGSENVVLRVPADAYYDEVHGAVVDRDGLPIADASVSVSLILHRSENGWSATGGKAVRTDEAGRFVLERVPRRFIHLSVSSEEVIPDNFEVEDCEDPSAWTLEVARRCQFRLTAPETLDGRLRCEFLDADGESLSISTFRSGSSYSSNNAPVEPGTNPIRAVSQDARKLVVTNGDGDPVFERELFLDPAIVTEIAVEL